MPSMQTRGTGRSGSELHDQPDLQLVEPVAQFLMQNVVSPLLGTVSRAEKSRPGLCQFQSQPVHLFVRLIEQMMPPGPPG